MSFTLYVINGKIPETKLKQALMAGKIVGSKLVRGSKKGIVGIQYDATGFWEGFVEKGNVVEFTEYAGGHGKDSAMDKLLRQLETTFHCDITADEDEYNEWTIKTTGKPLPKDPFPNCNTVEYSKKYPKGHCVDKNVPDSVWKTQMGSNIFSALSSGMIRKRK
jgi:hypothetical protein